MPIAQRIRLARKRAQLSQEALALRSGITKQSVSKYERGKATPTSGVLMALAEAAGVTVDFLMRPARVELGELKFRKLSKLGARKQNSLEAYVQDALERRLTLEQIVYGEDYPRFQGATGFLVEAADAAEDAAEKCRDDMNLGWDPIADLTEVLETWSVRVIEGPSDIQHFDGVSDWVAGGVPFIMFTADPQKAGDRQRFTLAHELGHLLCTCSACVDDETAANRFAAALLVPKKALISELGADRNKLDWRELFRLKHTYGISMAALVHRARDCGIISDATFNRMYKDLSQRGWRKKEPWHVPRETPHGMEKLLDRALAEGLIEASRAAELYGTSLAEFQARRASELASNVRGA